MITKYSSWGLLIVLCACAALNISIYLRIGYLQCKNVARRKLHQWRVETRKRKFELLKDNKVAIVTKYPQISYSQSGWLSKIAENFKRKNIEKKKITEENIKKIKEVKVEKISKVKLKKTNFIKSWIDKPYEQNIEAVESPKIREKE